MLSWTTSRLRYSTNLLLKCQEVVIRTCGFVLILLALYLFPPNEASRVIKVAGFRSTPRDRWLNHQRSAALWHIVHDETQQGGRLQEESKTKVLQQIWEADKRLHPPSLSSYQPLPGCWFHHATCEDSGGYYHCRVLISPRFFGDDSVLSQVTVALAYATLPPELCLSSGYFIAMRAALSRITSPRELPQHQPSYLHQPLVSHCC